MVARIRESASLSNCFFYNENKVKEGVATCILAENYPLAIDQLRQDQRLKMLTKMAALRPNVKVNALHISLNFDPTEKLSQDDYRKIARDYMERIGFGQQPFLVYEHTDAGHPHIHLLTTNIRMDGSKIDLHKLGYRLSEPARKAIEINYGLVRAEDSGNTEKYRMEAISAKALYGKTPTKRAIQNVLQATYEGYRYSSFAEWNALLKLSNVIAMPGAPGTRMNSARGLIYRVLDEKGEPTGTPIKASAFFMKPTLDNLDLQFRKDLKAKLALKNRLRTKIDLALLRAAPSLEDLSGRLKRDGVDMIFHQNDDGFIYGLTYIDHIQKAVFKGSDLGKAYSAKAVLERCNDVAIATGNALQPEPQQTFPTDKNQHPKGRHGPLQLLDHDVKNPFAEQFADMMATLFRAEEIYEPMPYELRIGKKKKKKKRISR